MIHIGQSGKSTQAIWTTESVRDIMTEILTTGMGGIAHGRIFFLRRKPKQ
jgi:hypothetical protein